ncbi:hypothetical protein DCMF_03530 [Candidatus Formimonas warabiya]|uniref:Uncharacterized protein n=1 Tax=Formimonas warabiya TaxID=1761012 RepID=A0A3G1KNE0_FORW1|nr:hypothetical protein DCMF_03530 [Candidatus Formimonas warabiya]
MYKKKRERSRFFRDPDIFTGIRKNKNKKPGKENLFFRRMGKIIKLDLNIMLKGQNKDRSEKVETQTCPRLVY